MQRKHEKKLLEVEADHQQAAFQWFRGSSKATSSTRALSLSLCVGVSPSSPVSGRTSIVRSRRYSMQQVALTRIDSPILESDIQIP